MKTRLLFFGIILGLATSCGRQTDYYYFIPPQKTPEKVKTPAKLTETVTGFGDVDVLWIIDNSGSMMRYQQSVIQNAELFMKQFTLKPNVQWNMGLISTDTTNDPFLGIAPGYDFNWKTLDPIRKFKNAVSSLGTNGSGYEKPMDSAITNLKNYPNFLRKNTLLAIIMLTDAPDQSVLVNGKTFLDYLVSVKGDKNLIKVYPIIAPAEFGCYTEEGTFYYRGSSYEYLVNETQGEAYKICAPDYGVTLSSIANKIITRIESPRAYLKTRPNPATIKVLYKGQSIPPELPDKKGYWIYNVEDNAIIFTDMSFAPGGNEEVEVQYEEEGSLVL